MVKKIHPKKKRWGGGVVQQLQLEEKALVEPSEDWPRLPCFLLLPGSQQHDQGLTLLCRQLLATAEKAGQFGNSIHRNPAMLPMTLQNIQLLGSTVDAGGHRKK